MDLTIRSAFVREAVQGAALDLNESVARRAADFDRYNPGKYRANCKVIQFVTVITNEAI